MAKTRALNGVALSYPASTAYKQWAWKEIRRRGKTLQWLVDEMKSKARAELIAVGKIDTISTATVSQILGPEGEVPPPSSTVLLPAMNKVLGLAPPPVCDPTDELAQLTDRFRERWAKATPRERAALIALLGGNDDEGDVDRDREGSGRSTRRG